MKNQLIKKKNWKEIGFLISVGIVPLINFLVFKIWLNINSILLAFQTTSGNGTKWGFENFKTIFNLFTNESGGTLLLALRNTAIWFCLGLFMYIPGILSTYFVFKKIRGHRFIAFMTMLPGLLPAAAYVGFVKYLIAPFGAYGYVSEHLVGEMAKPLLQSSIYANNTMIVYTIVMGLGINLLWSGAMNGISTDIFEAARVDGANSFVELTQIILPLIFPTLAVNLMVTAAGILGASGPILVFTNGQYDTTTLSFWIFSQVKYAGNNELPATLGLLMTFISMPLVFIVKHFSEKVDVY